MILKIKFIKIYFVLLVYVLNCIIIYAADEKMVYDSVHIYASKFHWANENIWNYPEESYVTFEEIIPYFRRTSDTQKYISCLIGMSNIAKKKGEYGKCFNLLWEAMYQAEENKLTKTISILHRKLSALYDVYGMDDLSMEHIEKAMDISRTIYTQKDNNPIQLNVNYLSIAVKNRKMGNYRIALEYLDSCIVDNKVKQVTPWYHFNVELERAKSLLELGMYNLAKQSIDIAKQNAPIKEHRIPILLNLRLGEYFHKTFEYDSAEYYYKNCLKLIESDEDFIALKTEAERALSLIFFQKQKYYAAYISLEKAFASKDNVTNSIIKNINEIFKINNTYHTSLQNKNKQLLESEKIIKEKSELQVRLQIIIVSLIVIIVSFATIWRMKAKLRKTILEKRTGEMTAVIEKEKARAKIQLKNQELTSYTLQLVDKESSVNDLLSTIKELSPDTHKKLALRFKTSNNSLWNEFNKRFTEVNNDFYERLNKKHPNLTTTEQKHCALIKLKLSTKEMSQILNVEGRTINMSRSRIRKKMGLNRDGNLGKYINEL